MSVAQTEPNNELVIRIQPDEAVYLKMNNKVPGLGIKVDTSRLDLQYKVCGGASSGWCGLEGRGGCQKECDRTGWARTG
jgi:hypothetical protein